MSVAVTVEGPAPASVSGALRFALVAGLVAALFIGLPLAIFPGLASSDTYRHLQWAFLLRTSPPGAIREFPAFTLMHLEGVDLWWLYHRLLLPFTFLDREVAMRVAAAVYGGVGLGAIAFAQRRLCPSPLRAAALFGLLLAFGTDLVQRATAARPSPLTVGLLALTALAYVERRAALLLLLAFLHGWLHITVVLQGVLGIAALGAGLFLERRAPWRLIAAGALGSVLGMLAHPSPLKYLHVLWVQGTAPLVASRAGFPDMGLELYAPDATDLLLAAPMHLAFALTLLGTLQALRRRTIAREELFLALAVLGMFAFGLRARRFLDFTEALEAVYIAQALRFVGPLARPALRRASLALLPLGLLVNLSLFERYLGHPPQFERLGKAAAAVAKGAPPGTVVFHDEWRSWPTLFYFDPTHRYVIGADQLLMLSADPHRFWLWFHLSNEGKACSAPSFAPGACPDVASTPQEVQRALAEFGARAAVLDDTALRPALRDVMRSDPARFPLLYTGSGDDADIEAFAVVPP